MKPWKKERENVKSTECLRCIYMQAVKWILPPPIDAKSRGNLCHTTPPSLSPTKNIPAFFEQQNSTLDKGRARRERMCLLHYCVLVCILYVLVCAHSRENIPPQNTYTRYVKLNALTQCSHTCCHTMISYVHALCVRTESINEWLRAFEFTTLVHT